MKKYRLIFAALIISIAANAQHTQTESKTDIISDKAMLDGKAFAVTLTENTTGTTGTPGNVADDRLKDSQDMTKRDVENSQTGKSNSMNSDLKDNRKMLIRFESSEVKISGKGEIKNEKCPYKSWGMESTGISFSADCKHEGNADAKSGKTNAGTLLTGTVNGDTIHGTMTCTKEDGTLKTFSYTGTKAGPNDLDMEQEMGLK